MATERHWNSGLTRTVLEGPGEAQLRPHRSRVRHSPPLQQPHEAPTAPRTATGAPGTGQAACETAPRSQVTTGHRPLCLPPKLQRSRAELPRQRGLGTLKEGPAATPTPPHTRCPRTEAPHARASAPLQPQTRRLSERKGACSRCGRAPRSPPTCLPGVPPPRHGEEEGAQQGHGDGWAAHRKNSALIVVAEDKKPAPENAHLCKRQTSHPLSRGWGGVKREKARRSHNNNKTGKKR